MQVVDDTIRPAQGLMTHAVAFEADIVLCVGVHSRGDAGDGGGQAG